MIEVILFDKELKPYDFIAKEDIIEYEQTIELNGLISAITSIAYRPSLDEACYFGDIEDDSKVWIYKVNRRTKQDKAVELQGVHIFYDELKTKVIRDIRPQDKTPAQAIGQILEGTGWTVKTSSATYVSSASYYYQSALSAFYQALQDFKCEFKISMDYIDGQVVNKNVYLYDKLSDDYGAWYEEGDNLLSLVAEEDSTDLYTCFIGRGRGELTEGGGYGRKIKFTDIEWKTSNGDPVNKPKGQDWVGDPEAIEEYGHRETVIDFDTIEDPRKLLEETWAASKEYNKPKRQYKSAGIPVRTHEVGETVSIVGDMDISYKARVFKIVKDRITKALVGFELGDKLIKSEAERIRDIKKDLDDGFKAAASNLEDAFKDIDLSYKNSNAYIYDLKPGNEYGLPAGLYTFDLPIEENPMRVTYVGGGMVLIANEKNPDGSWRWRIALAPEGIYGDELITGSVTANKLAADVGQSLDLSSNVSINALIGQSSDDLTEHINSMISDVYQTEEAREDATNQRIEDLKAVAEELGADVTTLEDGTITIKHNIANLQANARAIQENFDQVTYLIDNNSQEIEKINGAINRGIDPVTGDTFIELINVKTVGEENIQSSVRITDKKIEMKLGDQSLMWIEDGEVYATNFFATEKIGFGNHVAMRYRQKYTIFTPVSVR